MGHQVSKQGYDRLVERLNRFPHGVPPTEALFNILRVMFSEEEARLMSLMPIGNFTIKHASKKWKKSIEESKAILEDLASRMLLIDIENKGEMQYLLPPPMIGFFEFSMMRIGTNLDQKAISELFYEYVCVEDDFILDIMSMDTALGRAMVREETIDDKALYVLDYEKASKVIEDAKQVAVSVCYCRHVKHHLGTACDAPLETCMSFNNGAKSLVRNGYAREVSKDEAYKILAEAKEHNLVQFAENVQKKIGFICNCCSCCCEVFSNARKHGLSQAINSSNYIARISTENCTACSKCIKVCPMDAISLTAVEKDGKNKKVVEVNNDRCVGCGVCVGNCNFEAIKMEFRDARVFTPVSLNHKLVLQALEKGKLQNLIFRDHTKVNHRVLASILGVILKLPPLKQALATEQLKSRYLKKQLKQLKKQGISK